MKTLKTLTLFFGLILLLNLFVFGQKSRPTSQPRQPKTSIDKSPDSPQNALPKINSQADFDKVGRVYHQGTPYALPHTMFVIDRRHNNKIYYVNSQKFRFHQDFLYATGLAPLGSDLDKIVYSYDDRRFIVGTIAWQKTVDKWTWELWEGDLAKEFHIKTAHEVINKTFFQPVSFKPNSVRHEEMVASLNIPKVTQDEINKNQEYLALNTGKAVGRIHIIEKLDDTVEIGDNEILILKELPESLPPVRGIIVAKPSTPLSHINILARGWNIPNVYIKDADKLYKEYNERWVSLEASLVSAEVKPATLEELKTPSAQTPLDREAPSNLNIKKIANLREMRKIDSIIYGAKSANLGELLNSKTPNFTVPEGFTVPFYWYDKFMKENGFDKIINENLEDNNFIHNPRYRKGKLEELRKKIQNGKFNETLKAEIINKWKTELGGKPVFVRSSSNSEDLPNFSGAGLYDSIPNVKEEEKLIEAVKSVWASLWNFPAYEARVRNYVDQQSVYMSALIQIGIDMDRGGVMISADPFDKDTKGVVYISANCGHNSGIVKNKNVPEQILFDSYSNSVVLLTLSDQKEVLRFNPNGDLTESPDKCADKQTKRVLTNFQARVLALIALNIKNTFGNKAEQDIEWGIMNGKVYVVQSRPYIEKK